ncbi:hypothetical protein ACQZV8_13560, partial [Magnetococcales bacterium HHB-1]
LEFLRDLFVFIEITLTEGEYGGCPMSGKGKEEVKGARMTSFLTKAHAEHSYLEIHIGGRDQTLFAYFADHPPQPLS